MSINFTPERWEKTKTNYRQWWAGELDRPLIHVALEGGDHGRPEPELPSHRYAAFYDLSIPAEEVVDRWDYNLSGKTWLGDGFPCIWPNFGAGVIAALLGA